MSRYIFAPSAKQDLAEINQYLIRFSPAVARRLKEKIQKQCKLIAEFPQMGKQADKLQPGLRTFPVDEYLIFYLPSNNKIEIVRIVSGYRDLEALFSSDE